MIGNYGYIKKYEDTLHPNALLRYRFDTHLLGNFLCTLFTKRGGYSSYM